MILRKYRNGFTEEKSLISKVLESLSHGTEALNGRKLDFVSRSFVKKVIGDTNLGETIYLKDRFLEFIRIYSKIF